MILAFDIGNSAVKGALYDGDKCVQRMHFSSEEIYSPTGIVDGLKLALDDRSVDAVGCVSVVPVLTDRVQMAVQIVLGLGLNNMDVNTPNPLSVEYETPLTLGADRLAAVTAAHLMYGKDTAGPDRPVIVVDAGTAVTCDFVSADGVYSGGSITAGPQLVRDALHTSTAQLPNVDLQLPDSLPARSTNEAVQAGVMYGFLDATSGMIGRLKKAASGDVVVVATGGWATWLAQHCYEVDLGDPDLVLHGVRFLLEYAEK